MSTAGGTDGAADVERPQVPRGRYIWLADRGRTFARELAGPPGAPTVVLLHGWTATADLNWWASYAPLAIIARWPRESELSMSEPPGRGRRSLV